VGDGATLGLGVGVTVAANTADRGSGVFVEKGGKLTLSNSATVVNEVFLHAGDTIAVSGRFTGSANVTLEAPIVGRRQVLSGATGSYDNYTRFTVTNDGGAWSIDAAGGIGEALPDVPTVPAAWIVTFDTQGGSAIVSLRVSNGDAVERPPADPVKAGWVC
jgi:hypothetical protein